MLEDRNRRIRERAARFAETIRDEKERGRPRPPVERWSRFVEVIDDSSDIRIIPRSPGSSCRLRPARVNRMDRKESDMKRPIEYCYWAEPGKLLAGEYPRELEEAPSRAKMAALKDAGVALFVDLTEENEPARGGIPLAPYAQWAAPAAHMRFPIVDECAPETPERTVAILDAIDECIAAGKIAYVHCWGGVGRTGVIVGCWLARHGKPGRPALERLRALWRNNPKSQWMRVPNTRIQEKYILDWREDRRPRAEGGNR